MEQFSGSCSTLNLAEGRAGPLTRATGERNSRADVFFVDADVVLAGGALQRLAKSFSKQPALGGFWVPQRDCVTGGLVSQYRNLLHHFVHRKWQFGRLDLLGGLWRDSQRSSRVGGFDDRRFPHFRSKRRRLRLWVRELGFPILLDKELQGTHLKRWTFYSMNPNGRRFRAVTWSRLILQTRNMPADLNLKVGQRVSFARRSIPGLVWSAFGMAWRLSSRCPGSRRSQSKSLRVFFFRRRGVLFAAGCVALHPLYYLYSGLVFLCLG